MGEGARRRQGAAAVAGAAGAVGPLASVINETWTIALEMANDRLNTERAALEQIRIDLEQSRREAVDLADQLNVKLEQAQATVALQATREAATALDVERLGMEGTRLSGALAGASESFHTAQAALTKAHARAEQLAALLDREQAARAEAVERAAQAGHEAAVLAVRLDDVGRGHGREGRTAGAGHRPPSWPARTRLGKPGSRAPPARSRMLGRRRRKRGSMLGRLSKKSPSCVSGRQRRNPTGKRMLPDFCNAMNTCIQKEIVRWLLQFGSIRRLSIG